MSVTQTPSDQKQPTTVRCNNCNAVLPPHATFCGSCGQRIDKTVRTMTPIDQSDIAERYRITSLIHRNGLVQLLFAQDNQSHHQVIIRDIDLSALDEAAQQQALEAAQQECELLRQKRIPDLTSAIDLRYFQEHLYLVADWPFAGAEKKQEARHRQTLHDLLESEAGLPDEDTAISWGYRLSKVVERLHKQNIVLGDLDPHAILVDGNAYDGLPALMVSWLPAAIRNLLDASALDDSTQVTTRNPFSAPETQQGKYDHSTDIYSLGAILYLLLTGTAPDEATQRKKRPSTSPREINPQIGSKIDEVVSKALSTDPAKRFRSVKEFAEILLDLSSSTKPVRPVKNANRMTRKRAQIAQENQALSQTTQRQTITAPGTNSEATSAATSEGEKTLIIPRDSEATVIVRSHPKSQSQSPEKTVPGAAVPPKPEANASEHTADSTTEAATASASAIEDIKTQQIATISSEKTISMPALSRQPRATADIDTQAIDAQPTMALSLPPTPKAAPAIQPHREEASTSQPEPEKPAGGENDNGLVADLKSLLPASNALPAKIKEHQLVQRVRERVNDRFLPAISHIVRSLSTQARETSAKHPVLQQLQHFILGVQRRDIAAAALIEIPLRVQPDQSYTLRISIMGRDEPHIPDEATADTPLSGLSALAAGDLVHIEIRTTLVQRLAYVVQKADIQVPRKGYAAEVTIPMQPFESSVAGRRERLYVHFTDEFRNPLYEQPFAVELFVSPLVQAGREGHDVLTIPF
ncbi:hypothetical protein KSC_050920 [Ktedonobacter sp. SOSP1-52]|uniref:protein kinase domain-containing protein n=1 Tax=Ktedonobacter sp. SOSP1-52 TaxID=2778366 RepID=UPI00191614BE|nr:protein kinase [Ktedonobacter sp. SOSP1-52]GHO66200.1 hypothetical protein KSC_050920 [Ktedonobacter sp. SOSP1-52]